MKDKQNENNPLSFLLDYYNYVDDNKIIHNYRIIKEKQRLEEIKQKKSEELKKKAEAEKILRDKIDNKLNKIINKVNTIDNYNNKSILFNKNDETIQNILNVAKEFIKEQAFIDENSKIMVAVSGGVDSIVLLDVLNLLRRELLFDLHVVHFNHGLRGTESDADENFVKSKAKEYNLEFASSKGNVKTYSEKNAISIEFAARTLRYNFFERVTRTYGADFLATAHTSDDSAETFLINLFRGSGLTGLSGIPAMRTLVKNVQIIRPLITLRKSDLISYAKTRNLKWNEDSSNKLVEFRRNKIRNELLPQLTEDYNPAIREILNRTATILHGADIFIGNYVQNSLPRIVKSYDNQFLKISVPILETFDEFIQGELLQAAISKYFKSLPQTLSSIERVRKLVESGTGSRITIGNNIVMLKDREDIIIYRKSLITEYNEKINVPGTFSDNKFELELSVIDKKEVVFTEDPTTEYFDADMLPKWLSIRNWEHGDKFTPLGLAGTMKVSDFLTNEKVSLVDKESVLVLTNSQEIVWVCGYRINHNFKINDTTKKVIKAVFKYKV